MKPKFILPLSNRFFLSVVSLLGLLSIGIWLMSQATNQSDVIGAADFSREANTDAGVSNISESGMSLPPLWIQQEIPAAVPLASTNAESADAHPAMPDPDDLEDLDEIREWARQNAVAALAWVTNAPAGPKLDAVAEMVCAQLAQSDAAQAVALAERFDSVTNALLENMVHLWADQDVVSASQYATNKPAGEPRDRMLCRVAFVLSKQSPVEAAKLVAELMSPGELQDETAISVLHQWMLRDANAAIAWARLFPEGGLRSRALSEVMNIAGMLQPGNAAAP